VNGRTVARLRILGLPLLISPDRPVAQKNVQRKAALMSPSDKRAWELETKAGSLLGYSQSGGRLDEGTTTETWRLIGKKHRAEITTAPPYLKPRAILREFASIGMMDHIPGSR